MLENHNLYVPPYKIVELVETEVVEGSSVLMQHEVRDVKRENLEVNLRDLVTNSSLFPKLFNFSLGSKFFLFPFLLLLYFSYPNINLQNTKDLF